VAQCMNTWGCGGAVGGSTSGRSQSTPASPTNLDPQDPGP